MDVGLIEAAASGDRGNTLRALRDVLARRLTECETRETAAIAKQLRETVAELEQLPQAERSKADELAARRDGRRTTPPGEASAARDPLDVGA